MFLKEMTITNKSGESISFGRHFKLYDDIDLSGLEASVNYAESTADGAKYQNTRLEIRDFDVPFFIHRGAREESWIEEQRILAYKIFNPRKNPLKIEFTTKADKSYYINANLESAPVFHTGKEHENILWLDGLLQFTASDPYVYSANEVMTDIATWIGTFEFPLEIHEEGIEMGYREESLIVNVLNSGQESTGMLMRFRALATVVNPSLINVNTYELFKLNFTMIGGDVIEVVTYRGKRSVTLTRNNERTNIFNALAFEASTFLQLEVGDNLFRYDADENLDNLEVSMIHTPRMIGV